MATDIAARTDGENQRRVFGVWEAALNNNAVELEIRLQSISSLMPLLVYQMAHGAWEPKKMDVAKLLLNWGDIAHKFEVLTVAAGELGKSVEKRLFSDGNTEHGAERATREVGNENEKHRMEAEDICVYIIENSPEIINYLSEGSFPSILHVAAIAGSDKLVQKIFKGVTDKITFCSLLKVKNNQAEGKTPLRLAVEYGRIYLIREILKFDNMPIDVKKLMHSAKEDALREILMILAELRPGDMDEGVLNYAIQNTDQELFKILQNAELCRDLFHRPGLLGDLTRSDRKVFRDTLLERFPHLVLKLDRDEKPLLSYTKDDEIRTKVVDLIVRQVSTANLSDYAFILEQDDSQTVMTGLRPSTTEVVRFLIADPPGTRREISFSLGGYGTWTTSAQSFIDLLPKSNSSSDSSNSPPDPLQVVNFETTLILVDIPIPDLPQVQADGAPSMIRAEVFYILDWLQQRKKVKGIYELCVRDSCYLPHNERIIRECVRNFDIEVLDWRRLDLSLTALHEASDPGKLICRNLKSLSLYAGGWPALAYWTTEGVVFLSQFEKLEVVYIYVVNEFVDPEICDSYAQEAQRRFDQEFKLNHPEIKFQVSVKTKTWAALNPSETKYAASRETTAVEMTKLGNFLEAYETLHSSFADNVHWRPKRLKSVGSLPPVLFCDLDESRKRTPYIRIAIIDNGVDPGSIDCRSISGSSFVPKPKGESNWWHITHPHGTKMARIITQLNPSCCIFAAKVGEGRSDVTTERVIKALDWAVAAGVDIVSISLTLKESPSLWSAINRALMSNVTIIASVDGEGGNSQGDEYPARYADVLGIGSANRKGEAASGMSENSADYLFPGEKLVARTEYLGGLGDTPNISGPSVATAVAAGVASLILACHRFALFQRPEFQITRPEEQRPAKVIETVFNMMSQEGNKKVRPSEGKKYVRPWKFFAEDESKSSWGGGDSVLKWIAQKYHTTFSSS
ncbi:hypothetical protein F5Y16DRAFT_100516 [Xylariaceae sp. FL0255]|nr:hypothetical protein F5Y16DRAFT_100516 [Xylariaceae sp. FL0255]